MFTEPGALLYAGNCRDLYDASLAGKVTLSAWTRRKYPGTPLRLYLFVFNHYH